MDGGDSEHGGLGSRDTMSTTRSDATSDLAFIDFRDRINIVMNRISTLRGFAIVLILVLIGSTGGWSEAIAPPPIPTNIVSDDSHSIGFLDRVAGWLVLRKYFPDLESYEEDGNIIDNSQGYHSWNYEVGTYLSLFYIDPVSFDVRGRLMFQSAVSPHGHWNFLASAFLSELKPSLRITTDFGMPYVYFRHSCKHDLDQQRRLIMHQGFGLGYESPSMNIFGETKPLSNTSLFLEAEKNIPAVFPDEPIERYKWGVHAELRSDLIPVFDWLRILALGRVSYLGNEQDDKQWIDNDYQLMLGLKFINGKGAYTIYLEKEKLSDSWIVYNTEPSYLWSIGVMFLAD